jgi:hypothetical protein
MGAMGACEAEAVAVGSGKSCEVFFMTSSNWSTIMMAGLFVVEDG